MDNANEKSGGKKKLTKDQVFSIPNLLSFFRILLIPVIVYLYVYLDSPEWTLLVITLSGITDVLDGLIARKFNMITDFGKAIDPVADKLTQTAILLCLVIRFPLMLLLLVFMVVKEGVALVLRIIIFKRTESVHGAEWHGKVNTVLLYLIMCIHVIWYNIPSKISFILIATSFNMMLLSSILYTIAMGVILSKTRKGENKNEAVLHQK